MTFRLRGDGQNIQHYTIVILGPYTTTMYYNSVK